MTQKTAGYAGNGTLYYEVAGTGDALVLGHAGFVDSRMWDAQWEDFSRQCRTVRFDLRGYGKSGSTDGSASRRDDLYLLLDELGVGRAHLLGCSLSGEVMLDFTLEHPGRVSSLILVSTVPRGFEFQGEPPATLLEMMAAVQQGEVQRAVELQLRLWVDGPFREPGQVDPAVRRQAAEMSRDALQRGATADVETRPLNPPACQRLRELRVPTQIVVGALDDPEILRAGKLMASEIEGAKLVTIPDSAHLPSMEHPALFNRIVTDFLASVE